MENEGLAAGKGRRFQEDLTAHTVEIRSEDTT